jgi:hypothetical protein
MERRSRKQQNMDGDSDLPRIYCNKCQRITNHSLIAEHKVRVGNKSRCDGDSSANTEYRLWSCAGCETATLEEVEYFYDYGEDGEPEWAPMSTFYPARTEGHYTYKKTSALRGRGRTLSPEKLRYEVIAAYNAGLDSLCAIGLRTWLESICLRENMGGRDLRERIEGLEKILSPGLVDGLHALRQIGNEAAHELTIPRNQDLRAGIEVLDGIMDYLYELPHKAREITPGSQLQNERKPWPRRRGGTKTNG